MCTSPAPSGASPQDQRQRLKRRIDYWEAQPPEAQALHSQYFDALTQMDTAATSLEAVEALLNPDPEGLGGGDRDNLAVLMGFILDSYRDARNRLAVAAQALEDLRIEGGASC